MAAIEIIKEYMASADLGEVAEALMELSQPALQHIFVKQVRCQHHTQATEHASIILGASQKASCGSS